jgi:WD40 repeat protein
MLFLSSYFRYNYNDNQMSFIKKYLYSKCLFCIRNVSFTNKNLKQQQFLLAFASDGNLILYNNDGDNTIIKSLNQSGINDVALWQDETNKSEQCLIATVGDDSQITVLDINLSSLDNYRIDRTDRAHSSAIVGIHFLKKDLIVTASKDQRIILWKLESNHKCSSILVKFVSVADISSMDVIETNEINNYRLSIVGVGIEVFDLKIN